MKIIKYLRRELKSVSSERNKEAIRTFFKEEIDLYGVKNVDVKAISKRYINELNGVSKEDVFEICDNLWKHGYMEECMIACQWSLSKSKEYTPYDFIIFERWLNRYVKNLVTCDTLCNHNIGSFIVMYPEFTKELKAWAMSKNRWVRRAAAVSLIVPAKKGEFLADVFEITDLLLPDNDDMVQKGYGWLLEAASEKHTKDVFEYVMSKKDVMPRTALRCAIVKMPKELKNEVMKNNIKS